MFLSIIYPEHLYKSVNIDLLIYLIELNGKEMGRSATYRLHGLYGTEIQSCSAEYRHCSSKQRKNGPDGNSEIKAASSLCKARTITSLSIDQMTSAQKMRTEANPK